MSELLFDDNLAKANSAAERQPSTELSGEATCPVQQLGIHIIPVRYALDEMTEGEAEQEAQPRFGLPDNWKGEGPFAKGLTKSAYTLRQLRDGWLYVLAEDNDNTFHEYEVRGTELIKYDMDDWVKEQGKTDRGEARWESSPFLTYNQNNTLYLAWSKQRWTWRLYNYVLANKAKVRQWMRKVPLKQYCRTLNEPHIGKADAQTLTDSVADIYLATPEPAEALLFEGHLTQTAKSSEEQSAEDIKPIAVAGDLIGEMTDVKSAIFVALDDPLADLQQLSMTLGREVMEYTQMLEEKEHKWALLETAAQVTALNEPEGFIYPESVTTEEQKKQYFEDLQAYFKLKNDAQLTSKPPLASFNTKPDLSQLYIIHRNQKAVKKAQRKLLATYGEHNVDSQGLFERWEKTQKWRNEVDNQALLQAIEDFKTHDKAALEAQLNELNIYRAQLVAAAKTFGWEPERGFVDTGSKEGQSYLSEVHFFISEAVTAVIDEKTKSWLEQEFAEPQTLLPLYLAGFHKTLYKKMGSELLPQKTQTVSFTDSANILARSKEMDAFLSSSSVQDSDFYNKLSDKLQPVFVAFKESAQHVSNAAISAIARVSASFSMLFSNDDFRHRVLIAEAMALDKTIVVDKEYAKKIDQWLADRKKLQQNLEELYYKLHASRVMQGDTKTHFPDFEGMSDKELAEYNKTTRQQINQLENRHADINTEFMNEYELKKMQTIAGNSAPLSDYEYKALQARYSKVLKEIDELYYAMPSMRTIEGEDVAKKVRLAIKHNIKKSARATRQAFDDVGGAGLIIFLLNVYDVYVCYGDLQQNNVTTTREQAEMYQKIAYTFAALGSIFQGKAWQSVGAIENRLLDKLITEALDSPSKASLTRYIKFTRFAASMGVLGTGIELFYLHQDLKQAHSSEEKKWLFFKGAGLSTMGVSAVLQGGATLFGSRVLLGFLVGGVVTGLAFAGGAVYLISTLVLNHLKKDDYQKWLRRLPWGRAEKTERFDYTPKGVVEALLALYRFSMQPKLSLEIKGGMVEHKRIRGHMTPRFQRSHFILKVELPAHLELSNHLVAVDVRSPKLPFKEVWTPGEAALVYECHIPETSGKNIDFDIEVGFFLSSDNKSDFYRKFRYRYSFDSGRTAGTPYDNGSSINHYQPLSLDEIKERAIESYSRCWVLDHDWMLRHCDEVPPRAKVI